MKPQLFALLTALAWGVGGYFEKKGLHQGNLSPQVGIALRTAVALVVLGAFSFPHWLRYSAARSSFSGLFLRAPKMTICRKASYSPSGNLYTAVCSKRYESIRAICLSNLPKGMR